MDINLEQLVKEKMQILQWIEQGRKRSAEIDQILLQNAKFKAGSLTGHVYVGNYHATVQKKKSTKWDQDLLEIAMQKIGEAPFETVFKREYKPRSKAALDSFLSTASEEQFKLVQQAMTTTETAPYVKCEIISEDQDA